MNLYILLLCIGIGFALESKPDIFELVATPFSATTEENIEIGIGDFNLQEKTFTSNANGLPSYRNQWYLGLKKDDYFVKSQFQFYQGDLNEFIKGSELLIWLKNDGSQIGDISCNINNGIKGVQIRLLNDIKIPPPNLRLKSALTSDEKAQIQGSPKEKTQKVSNIGTDDNKELEPFSEVILPSEQPLKSNKTFIERNWKFVVPPILIFVIMGFFAEPPESNGVQAGAVEAKE